MRMIMIGLAFCALAGCVGEAPTAAYDLQAGDALLARQAVVKHYHATLSGDEEVPPTGSLARGTAQFKLSEDGLSVSYRLHVANLEDLTMAHIHLAPAGSNGGVVVWLYPSAPPPVLIDGTTSGILAEGTFTAANLVGALAGMTIADLIDEIESDNAYVNVHTVEFGGGEIRGQVE
jgi:hypothetical protein